MPDTLIQILLVEDSPGDARLLREVLAETGPGRFRVRHAASLGDATHAMAGEERFDVVLLDLTLPDSQGLDTVQRMNEAASTLPIVVLTGLDDESLGRDAIRIGAQDYLIKGQVDNRLLTRTIHYAMARKALEAERDRLIEALRRARDELEQRVLERTADLRKTVEMLQAEVRARSRAEDALRSSETRMRLLLQQIPAIIWTTDTNLCLTSSYGVGPAASTLQVDEEGKAAPAGGEPRHPFISSHRRALQGDSLAYEAQLKDRVYQCHVEPLRGVGGTIVGCLGVAVDITEHRKLEEQRSQLHEQLHQTHKLDMIGRLAAGLGHDFGNVLATVAGYTSLAKTRLPDDHPAVRSLDAIEEAARQARGITNALLSFGRRSPVEKNPLNLSVLLEDSTRLLRHTLPATVELTTTACEPPLWIRADPVQMQQILLNLSLNARDAMPDGGQLEIVIAPASEADAKDLPAAGRPAQGVACLTVRDTGTGIPPDVQARMFEPFFTTKQHGRGSGLGLSIIHGIVEDLGGRIRVDSTVGKGTAFTILLPCIAPPSEQPATSAPAATAVVRDGAILLVDGNRHIRGVTAAALTTLGYDVMQADDAGAMLATWGENRERVRLLVVTREVLTNGAAGHPEQICRNGARVPVIVVLEEAEAGLDAGDAAAMRILRKPFPISQLKGLVLEMLQT